MAEQEAAAVAGEEDETNEDGKIILEFEDVVPGLDYSLKVIFGKSKESLMLFENKSYNELV